MLHVYMTLQSLSAGAMDRARSFARREDGATAAEYGLLVALIALVIVAGVGAFGTALDGFFNGIANTVKGWTK
jgi:pilus assembly protein Flp/PilA